MKPYRYTGLLAKEAPANKPDEFELITFDERQKIERAQEEQLINALFEDCGVPQDREDGWKQVALTLGARHIKAFAPSTEKKIGRPRENVDDDQITLEMAALIGDGKTVRNAADIVAKRRRKDESVGSIEQRFRRTMAEWKEAHDKVERAARKNRQK